MIKEKKLNTETHRPKPKPTDPNPRPGPEDLNHFESPLEKVQQKRLMKFIAGLVLLISFYSVFINARVQNPFGSRSTVDMIPRNVRRPWDADQSEIDAIRPWDTDLDAQWRPKTLRKLTRDSKFEIQKAIRPWDSDLDAQWRPKTLRKLTRDSKFEIQKAIRPWDTDLNVPIDPNDPIRNAIRPWDSDLDAPFAAVRPWDSDLDAQWRPSAMRHPIGHGEIAIRPWDSDLDAPFAAVRPWDSDLQRVSSFLHPSETRLYSSGKFARKRWNPDEVTSSPKISVKNLVKRIRQRS